MLDPGFSLRDGDLMVQVFQAQARFLQVRSLDLSAVWYILPLNMIINAIQHLHPQDFRERGKVGNEQMKTVTSYRETLTLM